MRRRVVKGRQGLSLVEILLVASILGLLARALVESTGSLSRVTSTGSVQALLQEQGEKALRSIIDDLRMSGFVTLGNFRSYPLTFDDGDAPWDEHDHVPATQTAEAGDPDFGPSREIVFVQPSDIDGDGRPDVDIDGNGTPELDADHDGSRSDGEAAAAGWDPSANTVMLETGLVWSHQELSYVLVTLPDGRNWLERRVDAGAGRTRRVARDVERVQFDTRFTDPTLGVGAVRVRVFLRVRDSGGLVYRAQNEATVILRNELGL